MKQAQLTHSLCLSLLVSPLVAQTVERPNIIYIFTDQHTANAMSCTGNPDVHTPNIDRLASAGIRFSNAYCTAPLSGPSRGAMFTGRYPDEVGLAVNGSHLPDSLCSQTLGTLVQNSGYECVYGGKWHVHELDIPDKRYGFSHLHPHSDKGLAEACANYLSQKHEKPFFLVASFDNPHNICEYARNQNLPYGNVKSPELSECPGLPANFAQAPYDADIIQAEKRKNFNLYPTSDYTPDDWRRYRYIYYKLVEKVDHEIGKIIDAIDKARLWENTVVIFSSDHGDGVGAHQWNQKSALYEEVIQIPLIVTLPRNAHAGTLMPQLVNNGVDFFATICDWTGATCPKNNAGISFRKLAESGNPKAPHQSHIITETRFDGSNTRGWVVRTPRYKYVLYDKGRYREQLFDIALDKGESRNLIMEKAYETVASEHRKLLAQWMERHHIKPTRTHLHDVPGMAW